MFVSLEDGEGDIELIVHQATYEKPHLRPVVLGTDLMLIKGRCQRNGDSCNVIA